MPSHITSLVGLFLRKPLELNPEAYGMSAFLEAMLRQFCCKSPQPVDNFIFNWISKKKTNIQLDQDTIPFINRKVLSTAFLHSR